MKEVVVTPYMEEDSKRTWHYSSDIFFPDIIDTYPGHAMCVLQIIFLYDFVFLLEEKFGAIT